MNALRVPLTLLFGVPALAGGVLLVLLEVASGFGPTAYLAFFASVALAGAALLATLWPPLRLTPLAIVAIAAAGPIGTAAGLAVERFGACCMFAYHQTRGYPFAWLGRGFESADYLPPEQAIARLDATGTAWHVQSGQHLVANVIFWAAVALIAVVAVRLGATALRAYAGHRDREPEPRPHHAEPVDIHAVDA